MSIAEGVYRFLGLVAPVNQRLSRFRLNAIPANWLVMALLGLAAFLCWKATVSVLKSRRTPETQSVRQLASTRHYARDYVAVEGRLATDAPVTLAASSASGTSNVMEATYVPLVDRQSGKAILVQFPANHSFESEGEDAAVQGMLLPITPAISRQLAAKNYMHGGFRIERPYMLVEGRIPGNLRGPLLYGGVAAVLLLSLFFASLTRNVVFMPDEGVAIAPDALRPAPGEALLVSGTFAFDAKTRRFFTHMPAAIVPSESGDTTFVSHIETSRTSFGLKWTEYSGLWRLAIRAGSMTERQTGHVFWGTQKFRAVRFTYVSGVTGKSDGIVVASATSDPSLALQG